MGIMQANLVREQGEEGLAAGWLGLGDCTLVEFVRGENIFIYSLQGLFIHRN